MDRLRERRWTGLPVAWVPGSVVEFVGSMHRAPPEGVTGRLVEVAIIN